VPAHNVELFGGPFDGHRIAVREDSASLSLPIPRAAKPPLVNKQGKPIVQKVWLAVYKRASKATFRFEGWE
jgi:hypothetical protein